jgi:tetratricopeptide (TPR) repeat protein
MYCRLRLVLYLTVVASLLPTRTLAISWLFKPVGIDATSDYSAADLRDEGWAPVRLPHREWDTAQERDGVYGWYRLHVTIPAGYPPADLVLKLGIVDDTDWTYFNGTLIGTTAAYNAERVYLIPAKLVRPGGDNVVAVKVYDIIGTGGLLSFPRLGVRLAQSRQWLFQRGDADEPTTLAAPELDDSQWERIALPDEDWGKRQPGRNVYGWYRLHFQVPEGVTAPGSLLDLGIVNEADQTFLNGCLIGATGAFPPASASAAGEPRLYPVPEGLLKPGADNVLAVRVFNGEAKGGVQGEPTLLIPAGAPSGGGRSSIEAAWSLYHQAKYGEACDAALKAISSTSEAEERARCLNLMTAASQRQGRAEDALRYFRRLTREHPDQPWSREAVQSVSEIQKSRGGRLTPAAVYLGQDRETKGDWWLQYGNDGFILCAALGDGDLAGVPGTCVMPSELPVPLPDDGPFAYTITRRLHQKPLPYAWVWAWTTEDRRGLMNPLTGTRTAACRDDKGEEHPFDGEGPDLQVTLDIPAGWWRVSAYLVDYDWYGTWHPRQHGLVLCDTKGEPLATAVTGKFGGGLWERFAVQGPEKVRLHLCKQTSLNTVLSAICIDRITGPAASPLAAASDQLTPLLRSYDALCILPEAPAETVQRASELLVACDRLASASIVEGEDLCALEWIRWQLSLTRSPSASEASRAAARFVTAVRKLPEDAQDTVILDHAMTLVKRRSLGPAAYLLAQVSKEYWAATAVEEPRRFAQLCAQWQALDYVAARQACTAGLQAIATLSERQRATALLLMAEELRYEPMLLVRGATVRAWRWSHYLPVPRVELSLAYDVYDAVSRLSEVVAPLPGGATRAALIDRTRTLADTQPLANWMEAKTHLQLRMLAVRLARLLGDLRLTERVVADASRTLLDVRSRETAIELLQETEGAALSLEAVRTLDDLAREFDLPPDTILSSLRSQAEDLSRTPSERASLVVVTAGEQLRGGDAKAARETLVTAWEAATSQPDTAIPVPSVLRLARSLGDVLVRAGDRLAVHELLGRLKALEKRYTGTDARAIAKEVEALQSRARAAGVL